MNVPNIVVRTGPRRRSAWWLCELACHKIIRALQHRPGLRYNFVGEISRTPKKFGTATVTSGGKYAASDRDVPETRRIC